jgi:hypothetical protein
MKSAVLPLTFLIAVGTPAVAQEALPSMPAPTISETDEAQPDWYQQFTFSSNDMTAPSWQAAPSQSFNLSWVKGDRWSVSVDLTSRDGSTPLPSEEMSAGADFLITPRISVGGAVRIGTTERELIELAPEEQTEAGIQRRSAFKF